MGLIEDIQATMTDAATRLDALVERAASWANSEAGQNVLYDLDFAMLGAQLGDYYEHTGWYFPVHPNLMREALEHLQTNAPFDARRAVRLVGPDSEHWSWIVEGLLASPSIQSRRAILDEAIFCMEHARWHAAVSTLLPVIEGHVADRSGQIHGVRVRDRLDDLMYREPASSMKVLAAVPALEILRSEVFGPLEFGDPSQPVDVLNRHWVVHGRAAAFGTPVNACRTFMLVVALVELFDGAIALRASSAPVDTGALLDEHGPLALLRAAAAQRCARASRRHRPGRIPGKLPAESTPASACLTRARAGSPSL